MTDGATLIAKLPRFVYLTCSLTGFVPVEGRVIIWIEGDAATENSPTVTVKDVADPRKVFPVNGTVVESGLATTEIT